MSLYNDASLAMIPSAVKDGKLYSIRPTDGSGDFTFSRGSNLAATRVDVNGLIEKGRENLLLQSNQFDTTWTLSNVSVTSGQSGYDGSNDAWLLTNSASGAHVNQSVSDSGVITISVYAKAGTLNWMRLTEYAGSNAWFDLANGVVGSTFSGSNRIERKIESVGGGWYRCSMTTISGGNSFRIYPATNDNDESSLGNIVIQDAQREQGLVATDYIETTTTTAVSGITEDLPRLDYSGGASCPSLLLEPQRSNVVTQSEYFGAWNTNGTASVTDNQAVSPEGVSNAALLDFGSTTSGANRIDLKPAISAGANYVFSVFVKNIDANRICIRNYNTTKDAIANFDFSSVSFTDTNLNVIDTIIDPFSNGWYRIGIVFNSGVDTIADVRISPDTTSGSDGEQIYVYGAQLEEGSYPTSYIPTYGSAVTRSYEVYEKTSATSLIGQTQGVLFVDFVPNSESNTQWVAFLGSGNKYIGIYVGSSKVFLEVANVTSQAGFLAPTTIVKGQRYKCAIAYAENDFVAYVNGVQINTDSSGSVPATSIIRSYYNTTINGIKTNQLLVYKTRLTNGELAALTTL